MELENYHETRAELKDLVNDILEESPEPFDGLPRGSGVGDPTGRKVTVLSANKRIQHLERTLRAIDGVLDNLDPEKMRLVELKYWQKPKRLDDVGIAMELHISRRTLYYWTDEICLAIATRMGLVCLHRRCTLRA